MRMLRLPGSGVQSHNRLKVSLGFAYRKSTAIDYMLEFSARHSIAPVTETFPMSKVNDAIERLRSGKARYRLVLENDQA